MNIMVIYIQAFHLSSTMIKNSLLFFLQKHVGLTPHWQNLLISFKFDLKVVFVEGKLRILRSAIVHVQN